MIDQQSFYNLPDVSKRLGNVSRSTLYRLIGQGKLVRVRLGGKALVTGKSLAGLIEELNTQPFSPELTPVSTPERAITSGDNLKRIPRPTKRNLLLQNDK